MSSSSYKVVIVGDGGVGKTTYVKKLLTGDFEKKYVATLGVEVHPLSLKTNYGTITFNFWDCAGVEKYGGLRDGYYICANACLAIYDCTNPISKQNVGKWINDVKRVYNNNPPQMNVDLGGVFPVVVCGNKYDLVDSVPNNDATISAKTNKNLYEPLLAIARALTNHPDLVFLE